jgi:hypothetical protein
MISQFSFVWLKIEKDADGGSATCQVIMEFTLALLFFSVFVLIFILALTFIEIVNFAHKVFWLADWFKLGYVCRVQSI